MSRSVDGTVERMSSRRPRTRAGRFEDADPGTDSCAPGVREGADLEEVRADFESPACVRRLRELGFGVVTIGSLLGASRIARVEGQVAWDGHEFLERARATSVPFESQIVAVQGAETALGLSGARASASRGTDARRVEVESMAGAFIGRSLKRRRPGRAAAQRRARRARARAGAARSR